MVEALERHQLRAAVGGALSGLAGGVAMVAVWTLPRFQAHDVWMFLKLGAAPWLGSSVVAPGFALGPVLLGASVHVYVALAWGFAFGMFAYGISRTATIACGLGLGLVSFVVMRLGLVPLLGLGGIDGLGLPLHLWFGFITATAFLLVQHPLTIDELRRLQRQARGLVQKTR